MFNEENIQNNEFVRSLLTFYSTKSRVNRKKNVYTKKTFDLPLAYQEGNSGSRASAAMGHPSARQGQVRKGFGVFYLYENGFLSCVSC
jgi:hypothetical protein